MLIVFTIVTIIVSAGALYGAFIFIKRKCGGSGSVDFSGIIKDINDTSNKLKELSTFKDSYGSNGQFKTIRGQVDGNKVELEGEKAKLKEIEGKLDTRQKVVEDKELKQQEIKTVKAEDEAKLSSLLANYADISGEAVSLEHKLAESLKNLDNIKNEVVLTEDQKQAVGRLTDALTGAGSRMRDLLTEYQTVKERLDMLTQQHTDLEEEYTKLVEQQLGE